MGKAPSEGVVRLGEWVLTILKEDLSEKEKKKR